MKFKKSEWQSIWRFVVLVATIFAAVEIPLRVALNYSVEGWLYVVDWIITGLFTIDIVLNFMTPIVKAREVIRDRRGIAREYFRTWFIIDFLAAIPFDLIAAGAFPATSVAFRVLRTLRLTRVVRLVHLAALMAKWQHSQIFNPSVLRLGFFLFWVMMFAHWIACGWLALGGAEMGRGESFAYLHSLYWTLTTLTTVGYGDITPSTSGQIVFTMVAMLLGVAVYGYVIGNVASLLANIDVAKRAHQKRVEHVVVFMKNRAIPPEIQTRVISYFNYLWESGMGQDEFTILSELPPSLRLELTLHLNRRIIQKVPLFAGASDAFVRELVSGLKPVIFTPGDYIIRLGEIGDDMFFINRGRVVVLNADEKDVVAELSDGNFFGEMSLLSSQPRMATIRAEDYCELYSLDKRAFDRVLSAFPEFAKQIRAVAAERTSSTDLDQCFQDPTDPTDGDA